MSLATLGLIILVLLLTFFGLAAFGAYQVGKELFFDDDHDFFDHH